MAHEPHPHLAHLCSLGVGHSSAHVAQPLVLSTPTFVKFLSRTFPQPGPQNWARQIPVPAWGPVTVHVSCSHRNSFYRPSLIQYDGIRLAGKQNLDHCRRVPSGLPEHLDHISYAKTSLSE